VDPTGSGSAPEHPIKAALKQQWPPMTQAKLARELDISEGTLGHYLRQPLGRNRRPPAGFYTACGRILNKDPDALRPPDDPAALDGQAAEQTANAPTTDGNSGGVMPMLKTAAAAAAAIAT
jgi:hypothetical protein